MYCEDFDSLVLFFESGVMQLHDELYEHLNGGYAVGKVPEPTTDDELSEDEWRFLGTIQEYLGIERIVESSESAGQFSKKWGVALYKATKIDLEKDIYYIRSGRGYLFWEYALENDTHKGSYVRVSNGLVGEIQGMLNSGYCQTVESVLEVLFLEE